jgi:hypothetical protein
VQVGSARLTIDAAPFGGDFEDGGLGGWVASGDALAGPPRRWALGHPATGFRGQWFLDSGTRGDGARGRLRSPPLSFGVDEVCFLMAHRGGPGLAVVLETEDGHRVATTAGSGDQHLRETCLDATPLGERGGHILVIDDTPADHLLADDFECLTAGRPRPCGGRADVQISGGVG